MQLIEASLRFPTVIFTIGLGIALLYWAFVLLGALDIDLLGGGDASGAAKGLGDLAGAGKAIGGGGGDVVGGGDADASKLGVEGADGGDSLLGLGRVPITISASLVLLAGWCMSLLGMHYGTQVIGEYVWVAVVIGVLALMIGMLIAAVLVKPIAPVFAFREGKSNKDYVGSVCTITTGHVDESFGQATIEDGATVLVIPVRCDRTGALKRGAKALVVDFDPARNAYIVEPAGELADLPVT